MEGVMDKAKESHPNYERVIFNNSALELCIVQLKYPSIQRFSDEKYMVGIKEALADEYPLESTELGMNIVITPQGVSQTPGASMLRFVFANIAGDNPLSPANIKLCQ